MIDSNAPLNHEYTIDPISNKAFITVDSETILLAFPKKKYSFAISEIDNIYISKKRPGKISTFFNKLLAVKDTNYYLYIDKNATSVKIPIDRLQRYYCVKLVALLRQSKNSIPDFV